jgi:type VI secretion system secreted protein Hcp
MIHVRALFSVVVLGVAWLSVEPRASADQASPAPRVADTASPAARVAVQSMAPVRKTAAFLKFEGIEGESTDAKHRGWIEIMSYSWGSSKQAAGAATGASGKVDFSPFSITKQVDKASPVFREAQLHGTHIKSVVFEVTNATKHEVYQVTMSDVLVSSVSVSSGGDRPSESLSLNFAKIEMQFAPQKPDGTLAPFRPVEAGWDLRANTKI